MAILEKITCPYGQPLHFSIIYCKYSDSKILLLPTARGNCTILMVTYDATWLIFLEPFFKMGLLKWGINQETFYIHV